MRKIIGVTVGTPTSPRKMGQELKPVKTVNGQTPDKNGNVAFDYATEQYVQEYAQPKGEYLTEHQDISGKLDSAELPKAVNAALAQAKESGEFDGKDGADGKDGSDGKDGVSATHSWNGTVLTVTSASGTSSADLKGEKGEDGADGYTPVKGTDYFTEADKTEIAEQAAELVPVDETVADCFATGAGEPFFTHTAYFATDTAATTIGELLEGVVVTVILDTVYWLEVNGELLKCHWERDGLLSKLYDEDKNERIRNTFGNIYMSAPTAGTYTYTLYAPTEEMMLDPECIPPNVAKKSDIPDVSGMVKSVNGATPDANGNVTVATGGSGGSGVDVTATVGQTIVVEEVDANGKPTKWKAADYPLVENEIIPQTTYAGTYDSSYGCFMYYLQNDTVLKTGGKYTVVFDGVEYTCTAQSATIGNMALTFIGNGAILGNNTGEPFALANIFGYNGYIVCMGFDGNQHSVRVYTEKFSVEYVTNAFPYCIEATDTKNDDDRVVIHDTAENILSTYKSGRPLIIALDISEDSTQQKKYFNLIQAGIVAGDWSMIFVCAIPSSGSTNLSAAESITIYYVDGEMNVVERLE